MVTGPGKRMTLSEIKKNQEAPLDGESLRRLKVAFKPFADAREQMAMRIYTMFKERVQND